MSSLLETADRAFELATKSRPSDSHADPEATTPGSLDAELAIAETLFGLHRNDPKKRAEAHDRLERARRAIEEQQAADLKALAKPGRQMAAKELKKILDREPTPEEVDAYLKDNPMRQGQTA